MSEGSLKKKVGMVVAIEMEAFFEMYPDAKKQTAPKGFELFYAERDNYELFAVKTGMGEIAAAAGVQLLSSCCGVSMIVNFGVVGGLTDKMSQQKVCLVNRVVHYKYDCSEFMDLSVGQVDGHDSVFLPTDGDLQREVLSVMPSLQQVTCCSGDKFVGTSEEKQYLHRTFEGDICDMESAGIVLASEMNELPCLLLKAVSDGLSDGAAGFYAELLNASRCCLQAVDRILGKI